MARTEKAPAAVGTGAGAPTAKAATLTPLYNLHRFRAQRLAARYALPLELAATVAPLIFGGAHA